jgi:hypothetical protein
MNAGMLNQRKLTRWHPGIPLRLSWTGPRGDRPVPQRVICISRHHRRESLPDTFHGNGYHANGLAGVPFDFSAHMQRLCAAIVAQCEVFHHITIDRILFAVSQARKQRTHGLQAKVTPMRFREGQHIRERRGRLYQVQRYAVGGVDLLYLMSFCLPRFLDQSFDQKFVTIFHELYHIAPEFNGDLRRHGGRCHIHTHSKKGYDSQMEGLVREYLHNGADPTLHAFLRLNFQQLEMRHGHVYGLSIPTPKLVPVVDRRW